MLDEDCERTECVLSVGAGFSAAFIFSVFVFFHPAFGLQACCRLHPRFYQTTERLLFLFFIMGCKQCDDDDDDDVFFVLGKNVESDLESFTENKIFYILKKPVAFISVCLWFKLVQTGENLFWFVPVQTG